MPKIEVFTVQVGSNIYNFATGKTDTQDQLTMSYKSYLVPFNGLGMMCSVNKNSLTSDGIMITRLSDCTQIDYRDSTTNNAELIGVYADKSTDNSETLTYMKNDKVVAKVTMKTHYFNEEGVKYSLAKLYQRPNLDFNYYTNINVNSKKKDSAIQKGIFRQMFDLEIKNKKLNFLNENKNNENYEINLVWKNKNLIMKAIETKFEQDDYIQLDKLDSAFNNYLKNGFYNYIKKVLKV